MNFWCENKEQLITTTGGIFVAILAAFLTYWLSQIQRSKNEKKAYNGTLYTIFTELEWHLHQIKLLKNTLEELERISIEKKSFALNNSPTQFDLSLIEKALLIITDYKNFNHELLVKLTSYKNLIRDLNSYLNFKNANELLEHEKTYDKKRYAISGYFQTLNDEYLKKAHSLSQQTQEIIKIELRDYLKKRNRKKSNK